MGKFLSNEQLGNPTATTINKVAITQPANGSTLTIADGKTLTASNTLMMLNYLDSQDAPVPLPIKEGWQTIADTYRIPAAFV